MGERTVAPRNLADWLIERGRHFICSQEAAELLGVRPGEVWASLGRARQARKMASVTKGGWVPVPPEYREAGAPPPLHYVDPLMAFLGHPYYVGFLSAAALHGAAHHPPMVLQVVTPARLRSRRIGANRISFVRRSAAAQREMQLANTPTGRVRVSTPATTVLDLAGSPRLGGGVSNIATVVGDLLLSGALELASLLAVAPAFPKAAIQRAGLLVQFMAEQTNQEASTVAVLDDLSQMTGTDWVMLVPGLPPTGARDHRWRVVLNAEVEHDL